MKARGLLVMILFAAVACEGQPSSGPSCTLPQASPHPVSISGGRAVMALFSDGSVRCWGSNDYGECATGWAWPEFGLPVLSTELSCIVELGGALARDEAGAVYYWTDDRSGQRGGGQLARAGKATTVPGLKDVARVAGDGASVYALDGSGQLYWWGALFSSPTDPNVFQTNPGPLVGLPKVVAVASSVHDCAVDDTGGVWCWGYNDDYQLGDEGPGRVTPQKVEGLGPAREVFVGGRTTCARLVDDTFWCWGSNKSWLLGRGDETLERSATPARVDVPPAKSAAIGVLHTCVITQSSELYCWGIDTFGSFGWEGGVEESLVPVRAAIADVAQVVAGDAYMCVLTNDHVVSCAGQRGMLGRTEDAVGDIGFKPVEFDKTRVFDGPPGE